MSDRAREESALVGLFREGSERFASALERSRLAGAVRRGWQRLTGAAATDDESDAEATDARSGAVERSPGVTSDAVRNSTLGGAIAAGGAVTGRLSAAAADARLAAAGVVVRCWALGSRCYRWLTAEPDPEVIVIDLRETRTVGPVIAVVDRAIAFGAASAPTSTLSAATAALAARVRARPLRVASGVVIAGTTGLLGLAAAVGGLTQPVLVGALALLGLSALGLRSRRTLAELCRSRPVRIVAAAFEPPAPPDRQRDERSDRESGGSEADAESGPS